MKRFSLFAAITLCLAPAVGTLAASPAGAATGDAISGTVTNASSTAIAGICADAFLSGSTSSAGTATTASNGTYTISGLAAGSYDIEFTTGCGNTGSYVTQWYNGAATQSAATAVAVTATTSATGINASLVAAGTVRGTVTDTSSAALQGICIDAYATTAPNTLVASASSAADGTYSLTPLPPASYDIEFSSGCGDTGGYLTQWYNGAHAETSATAVVVAAGATKSGVNAAMVEGATISGTVTSGSTGVSGLCVDAYQSVGQGFASGSSSTGTGGTYSMTGLATGSYYVEFTDGCGQTGSYATQWYPNAPTESDATAVVATAGLTTSGVNASVVAQTGTASISGTVTDAASSAALAGVCVFASPSSGGAGVSATTAANGTYTLSGLTAGSYDVKFSDGCGAAPGYVEQWYNDASSQSSATLVALTTGQAATGIDAAMVQGGTISGTVTNSSSTPLASVCVQADLGSTRSFSGFTASDGTYSIGGLPAGSYTVEFTTCGAGSTYAPQWYDDASSQSSATPVVVASGSTQTGINAVLVQGGAISGKVTGPAGGGLKGICVDAVSESGGNGGYAITAAGGTYTISGLAGGSYQVDFSTTDCSTAGNYIGQWYNAVQYQSQATSLTVVDGQTTPSINASLTRGATITGTVTDGGSNDLSGICVTAYQTGTSGFSQYETTTDAYGTYALTRLPAGSYDIEFTTGKSCGNTGNYVKQWYQDSTTQSSAKAVTVTPGTTTSSIDAVLAAGGIITGSVSASATPLGGICVNVVGGPTSASATTAADGSYSIAGLSSGTYQVEFSAGSYCGNTGGYLTQWYKGASSESTATPVAVSTGTTTSGIDAAMLLGGSISGTVKDSSGTTLAGICVDVLGGPSGASAQTAPGGTYTLSGLAPGSYDVEFRSGCGSNGYQTQWYKDAASVSDATPVKVVAGATVSAVNAALAPGGTISGTVKSKTGTALAGICVSVLNGPTYQTTPVLTASNGTYTIPGLAPGSYDVTFTTGSACANTGNYVPEFYKNALTSLDATPVKVTSGTTTSGIDASMTVAGNISGTVTNASSTGIAGICVEAAGRSAMTTSSGAYTIADVPAGSYQVEFAPTNCGSDTGYATQWYKGASTPAKATLVAVTNGKTTSGIDASLLGTGSISGTVTGPGSASLTGICVSATPISTGAGGSTTTGTGGTYTIAGLIPGTYDVDFSASTYCGSGGNYIGQWYKGAASASKATPVTVTAGTVTGSIDATLAQGGEITGMVTGAGSTPVSGVCVYALYGPSYASTTTASDGTYTLSGLATGSYDVEFSGCGGSAGFVGQWYKGASSLGDATAVPVTEGKTASGIDAQAPATGSISGSATNGVGTGLSGICVGLYDAGGTEVQQAITSYAGSYSFGGVPAGKYQVAFGVVGAPYYCGGSTNYVGKWYKNAQSQANATVITLAGGASLTGINATLSPAGSVTGKVTNAATSRALVGICVEALSASGAVAGGSSTSADGSYTIAGLLTGSYQVSFTSCGGGAFGPQWYKGASTQAAATPVAVKAGSIAKSIDAAMTAGGSIAGTVTNSAGHPLADGCVTVRGPSNSYYDAQTAADGTYSVTGLPTGTFDVEFFSNYYCNGGGLWYGGALTEPGATPVTVTAGTATTGINGSFVVSAGSGAIAGTVTDSASKPVAGICVAAQGASNSYAQTHTASNGTYSITGLQPGSYRVSFSSGCGSTTAYAFQFYKDVPAYGLATPVVVTSGTTTSSIDATMSPGGSIQGSVKAGTKAVAGVCVNAYVHGTSQSVYSIFTAADGSYSVSNLLAGTYDVEFTTTGYCGAGVDDATQWYANASSQSTSTPVTVTAGKATSAINALMSAGGDITGSADIGTQPVASECVTAYPSGSPVSAGSTSTNLAGTYKLVGLATGSYDVKFGCGYGTHAVQWYKGVANESAATAVAVTSGSTTSGISAGLVAGGSIDGTVVNTTSSPMGGVCVSAFDPGSSLPVAMAATNPDGTYLLQGLATSSYDVEFDPTCGGSPSDAGVQWYSGKTSQASANAVAVTAGSTSPGIGATLS